MKIKTLFLNKWVFWVANLNLSGIIALYDSLNFALIYIVGWLYYQTLRTTALEKTLTLPSNFLYFCFILFCGPNMYYGLVI
jgi:hypothetical protein